VRGRRIEALTRRGKYLIWELEDEVYIAMHLRMTGNLLVVPSEEDSGGRPHLRARLILDSASALLFVTCAASAPASCCWATTRWRTTSPPAWASSRSGRTSPPMRCGRSRAGAARL